MFTISHDELSNLPELEETISCPHCGLTHTIKTSGENKTSISYYNCQGKTFLAGIDGKSLIPRIKNENSKQNSR